MSKKVEVRINDDLSERLESYARKRQITKSIAIRAAIIKLLKERGEYYALESNT